MIIVGITVSTGLEIKAANISTANQVSYDISHKLYEFGKSNNYEISDDKNVSSMF